MKTISLYILISITISSTSLNAQTVIKSQKVVGSIGNDELTCMDATKDGGIIAGGYSDENSSRNKTEDSRGSFDYWIVKLDEEGRIEWDKTIGGSSADYLLSIQQTTDEGYILGGYSFSNISGEKTENAHGQGDYWIIKLDRFGKIEWDKTIGGYSNDFCFAVKQTKDNGYILGGISSSNIAFEKTENSRGNDDYWVVKLDAAGNVEWDKTIGGKGIDWLRNLQQTKDGGYILGGSSDSKISGEKTEQSRGSNDYWIVKLTPNGNLEWDKTIGGKADDYLIFIKQTNDDNYILGGYSWSNKSYEKTEDSRGGNDYWIVKLTNNRIIEWDKTVGGNNGEELHDLQLTIDGGYLLGGISNSDISFEKTETDRCTVNCSDNISRYDYWVVKLSQSGIKQWDKTIGGGTTDICKAIAVSTKEKNVYIVSGTSSSDVSGDKTKPTKGAAFSSDYWIVKLLDKSCVNETQTIPKDITISNASGKQQGISFYPNPASDLLHIQNKVKATFTLTNQSGKTILTKTINGNGEINVSHLPAGLYYLKNNETGIVQKIIIAK